MQYFHRDQYLCRKKRRNIVLEPIKFAKVESQTPALHEVQYKAQFPGTLEDVMEFDYEGVLELHKYLSLEPGVLESAQVTQLVCVNQLDRVQGLVALFSDQDHLAEGTLAQGRDVLEVLQLQVLRYV